MSTLLLVRHGQASFGTTDYDRLSANGERQVALLRDHWLATGETFDAIYAGTLRRQRHTAQIIAATQNLTVTERAEFDEYDADSLLRQRAALGALEHLSAASLAAGHLEPRAFQRELEATGLDWVSGRLDAGAKETWPTFRGRVGRGLRALMASEGRSRRLVVCTSAGVIGAAVAEVMNLSDHEALKISWAVHNSSITRLQYDTTRVSLTAFNAVPHLERPGHRELITFR